MDRKGREILDFSASGVLNVHPLVHSSGLFDAEVLQFRTVETHFECGKIFVSLNNLCFMFIIKGKVGLLPVLV